MTRSLTAADRTALIRLASTLPAGSPERRAILAGLQESAFKTAAGLNTESDWQDFLNQQERYAPGGVYAQYVREYQTWKEKQGLRITRHDVDDVLSALIAGPGWDSGAVQNLEREAFDLSKYAATEVLSGIKGWIESEDSLTPGMSKALGLIARIGQRTHLHIDGHGVDEAGYIRRLLDAAYVA